MVWNSNRSFNVLKIYMKNDKNWNINSLFLKKERKKRQDKTI